MITFTALIVARWMGWVAPNLSEAEYLKLWSIIEFGLGGYVVGRSVEKVAPAIATARASETDPEVRFETVALPDIQAACARFEDLGVAFQKRLSDGRMKNIAFIRDPDDYWVEIISSTPYQP